MDMVDRVNGIPNASAAFAPSISPLGQLLPAIAAGSAVTLDEDFIDALRSVLLNPQLDAAFKELALSVPSENLLYEQLETVNPEHVSRARESMLDQLAAVLHEDWAAVYEAMQTREGYRPDAKQSGQRALANLALCMLVRHSVHAGDRLWPGRAYQKVKDATNMTERLGALVALVHGHAELADGARAPALIHISEPKRPD